MPAGNLNRFALSIFGVGLILVLFAARSLAQGVGFPSNGFGSAIHGVPPSVTSFGFGGHPGFHGVPPSVTSLGFGTPNFRVHQGPFFFGHHRHNPGFVSPFFGGTVAVPYAYPVYVMEPSIDDSMEEDYSGGPTIYDRRGPGTGEYARRRAAQERMLQEDVEDDYRAELKSDRAERHDSVKQEPALQQEVLDQPRTVLVYKDGHRTEILNYAIVGSTLYELNDGLSRKVALAELDLPATVKQNDDRGVQFALPAGSRSN